MMISNLKPGKQPSRILVAVDGSDTSMNAADYDITLAKNNKDNNEAAEVLNIIDILPIFKCFLQTKKTAYQDRKATGQPDI
jgi:hypothetical protein